ncbi:MAG: PfkB family carbohydrate kinase [Acidimicrobiales bacterium]
MSVGEALVDVLPDGTAVPGGGPMNVAVAGARLGTPTAFVGRVSTDEHGQRIWAHLRASGVVLEAAQRGDEPTARAIVELAPGPVFRFEGEGTADASMTSVDLGPLGPGPKIVHGGTLGIFRGSTAGVLGGLIDDHVGLVSFDPNIRPQIIDDRGAWLRFGDRWLDRADIVKASDEDLAWLGMTPGDLLARGAAVVLHTIGARGAEIHLGRTVNTVHTVHTVHTVAAPVAEVVDAVGAGDSFIAAVLSELDRSGVTDRSTVDDVDDATWLRIVGFAARVAAVTVSRPGADPPWRSELGAES